MVQDYVNAMDNIPGWFLEDDVLLFQKLNELQAEEPPGDVLEIGVYHGKSAILLGYYVRSGEEFVVCDPFEEPISDPANQHENRYFNGLTRKSFEEGYLRFHHRLPTIYACSSLDLLPKVQSRSFVTPFRFVHIDGSHLYEIVHADIQTTKRLLRPGGVVILDDHCTHPGVSAAVWEEVARTNLRPFCLTHKKFYATWGSPPRWFDELCRWAEESSIFAEAYVDTLRGAPFLRVTRKEPHISLPMRVWRRLARAS